MEAVALNQIRLFKQVALFSSLLLGIAFTSCREHRHPNRYLIPDGYVGWVKTTYNAKDAPSLPRDGNFLVHRFSSTGLIITATFLESGWAKDEFYFYDKNNSLQKIEEEKLIHLQGNTMQNESSGKITNIEASFFVGTDEQYEKLNPPRKDENGKIILQN